MTVIPMKKPKTGKTLAKPYEPTPAEALALDSLKARKAKSRQAPILKSEMLPTSVPGTSHCKIQADHPDLKTAYDLMMESFGVTETPMLVGLLTGLSALAQEGNETNTTSLNFALSIARGIEPQDSGMSRRLLNFVERRLPG